MTKLKVVILTLLALSFLGEALAQNCGDLDRDIVFAGLDWDSAQLHNAITRYILEEGFKCSTDDIPGSTVPMIQGLARGDIDVYMELWANNAPEIYYEALAEEKVVDLGHSSDALEGWFVPRYVIEGDTARGIEPLAPELKSVFDLPQYAEIFTDPEEPEKGRFYNCIIGWQCEGVNNQKLEAYGLTDSFTNFNPGSGAAFDSEIEATYNKGEPIVTYYWGPTGLLGILDMVLLEEPEYSDECWEGDKGCAYPTGVINVAVGKEFAEEAPAEIIEFLKAYELEQNLVNKLLGIMREEGIEAEDAALRFLQGAELLWSDWVSDEVAESILSSLN